MTADVKLIECVLITRCQLRDRRAMVELIERYGRPVRYFIRRLVNDMDLVDELFQDTWVTVIRKIHTLKNPEKFSVWLYQIARNRVYQEFRRQRRNQELEETIQVVDECTDEGLTFEDVAEFHRCLDELKPLQKEVLMLRFLEQMSYEQIADVLACNIGTVRSRIHNAKRALRQRLEERQ